MKRRKQWSGTLIVGDGSLGLFPDDEQPIPERMQMVAETIGQSNAEVLNGRTVAKFRIVIRVEAEAIDG